MMRIERVIAGRRGLLKVETTSLDVDLPDAYSMATIDKMKAAPGGFDGRVLGYDRGHCNHHGLSPGAQCHCHEEGKAISEPPDCSFLLILEKFCNGSMIYWLNEGSGFETIVAVHDEAGIVQDLRIEE